MKPKYRLVCFDVDSTLVTIEGIDVLAGGNSDIARLTEAAMNGEIPLNEVYERRLELIRPSKDAVEKLGETYVQSLVEGAGEAITTLREAGVSVHLVTAGIEQAVDRLAAHLGLPKNVVHAVSLRFAPDGAYDGFDRRSYLTRSGGKELVVRDIRARTHGKAAFVGDGASDLETRPAVDLFIGFGGVQTRPLVKREADVFVDTPDLTALLPFLIQSS